MKSVEHDWSQWSMTEIKFGFWSSLRLLNCQGWTSMSTEISGAWLNQCLSLAWYEIQWSIWLKSSVKVWRNILSTCKSVEHNCNFSMTEVSGAWLKSVEHNWSQWIVLSTMSPSVRHVDKEIMTGNQWSWYLQVLFNLHFVEHVCTEISGAWLNYLNNLLATLIFLYRCYQNIFWVLNKNQQNKSTIWHVDKDFCDIINVLFCKRKSLLKYRQNKPYLARPDDPSRINSSLDFGRNITAFISWPLFCRQLSPSGWNLTRHVDKEICP